MKINYLSEFKITETSQIEGGLAPFKYTYYTSRSAGYVVSYDGAYYKNCCLDDDGNLLIIFENHGLNPGELLVKREYFCSDSNFSDGVCNVVSVENTNIELTTDSSTVTTASIELSPNYTRGYSAYDIARQGGFEGTQEEWLESIQGKPQRVMVSYDFDSSQCDMLPGVMYQHTDSPTSITVTLADNEALPAEVLREYMMSFTTGATVPTFSYPEDVTWCGYVDATGEPIMEADSYYELNIFEGRGIIIKW